MWDRPGRSALTVADRRVLAQVDEVHASFLVVCRCNGRLELFQLPELKLVAKLLAVHEGDATVPAAGPDSTVRTCERNFGGHFTRKNFLFLGSKSCVCYPEIIEYSGSAGSLIGLAGAVCVGPPLNRASQCKILWHA